MGDSSSDLSTLLQTSGNDISAGAVALPGSSSESSGGGFWSGIAGLFNGSLFSPVAPIIVNTDPDSNLTLPAAAKAVSDAIPQPISDFFSDAEPWLIGFGVLAGLIVILLIINSIKDII